MDISNLDWSIVIFFLLLYLAIGLISARKAGRDTTEYFLSGRSMPWWMLGISMVATTFSADTPNLVTDIVRTSGVYGNWVWWAFLLTGMLTVFVYAKLWRRSGILTDLEFYTLRYSGPGAVFLRQFRAVYLGLVFNVIIMASVMLAGIKIGGAMLGLQPIETILLASVVTVIYATLGGLRSVIITDIIQFILAMIGAIGAAIVILNLPEVNGINGLLEHPGVSGKIQLLPPADNWELMVTLLIIPLAVQWWSSWYPGAEPGGGGYIAQRILSAKNEKEAMSATLLFNVAHYAIRPWPWILVALASLIIFPDLQSLSDAYPNLPLNKVKDDLAYPAMMVLLPRGLIGIVLVSLMSAFMSTLSTHLNWGASYLVNDFYRAYGGSKYSEKKLVNAGRLVTVLLLILAGIFALFLENALGAFQIILQIGAGTGLIYILRWFWYRINAASEITAMIVSFAVAIFFAFIDPRTTKFGLAPAWQYVAGMSITTICWVAVTFITKPTEEKVLLRFYETIRPHPLGWKRIARKANMENDEDTTGLGLELICMIVGSLAIYSFLFSVGYFLYGRWMLGMVFFSVTFLGTFLIKRWWPKLKFR